MIVSDVQQRLRAALKITDPDPDYEGLCAGSSDMEVSGMATCFFPSVDVLKRAAAQKINLVVALGHPFYRYDPLRPGAPPKELIEALPSVLAKRELIMRENLAVVRVRMAWEAARPTEGPRALAKALGLGQPQATGDDFVVCASSVIAAGKWMQALSRNGHAGLRLLGEPVTSITRVAVASGLVTPAKLGRMLADPAVNGVVCGEVVEWEAGPYMQDVIASGRRAAMILTGFAASQEPNAGAMADWMRGVLPEFPVSYLPDANPIWTTRQERAR